MLFILPFFGVISLAIYYYVAFPNFFLNIDPSFFIFLIMILYTLYMSISKVLTKFIEARNGYAGISNESRRRYNSVLVAIILHGVIIYGAMILSWPYIKEEVSRKLFPPINLGAFIGLWIFNVLFFSFQSGLFGSTRGIFSDDKFDLYGKWSTFVKALYRKKFLELIAGNTLVIIPYII